MNTNHNGTHPDGCGLHRFEKNHYFHAKLMTAGDMLAEQDYHANRLHTLARSVMGSGLVCGLTADVTPVSEDGEDRLEISVDAGLALDCCGRPVVVEEGDAKRIDPPSDGERYIYLRYDECSKETVPIPGSGNACKEKCAYNRILEIFEIVCTDTAPEYKTVPVDDVEFPTQADLEADPEDEERVTRSLTTMARSYYEANQTECDHGDARSVFLGTIEEDDGSWEVETDLRPLVYGNDMLYAIVAAHASDFENPHEVTAEQVGAIVSVEGVENPGGNVDLDSPDGNVSFTTDTDVVGEHTVGLSVPGLDELEEDVQEHLEDTDNPHEVTAAQVGALVSVEGVEGDDDGNVDLISPDDSVSITTDPDEVGDNAVGLTVASFAELEERLDELEERHERDIERLTERLIRVEHYVMEQSLWCVCGSYGVISERFEGEPAELANQISSMAVRFLNQFDVGEPIEPGAYFDFLGDGFIDLQRQLIEEQTFPSTDLLEKAVEELRRTFDERDEENVLPVAASQNKVCKAVRCVHPIVIE